MIKLLNMEELPLIKLNLKTPLIYSKNLTQMGENAETFNENEEFLFCFELNPSQSRNIEPIQEQFLGNLLFCGSKTGNLPTENTDKEQVSLPQGHYLFVQRRFTRVLNHTEWLDMAIEQQKDGLWERNKLGNLLYVRFLHEDGAFVTQVFREAEE
jgi:hypothetical protein